MANVWGSAWGNSWGSAWAEVTVIHTLTITGITVFAALIGSPISREAITAAMSARTIMEGVALARQAINGAPSARPAVGAIPFIGR